MENIILGIAKFVLVYYFIAIGISVYITVKDKKASKRGDWRVPERTLMLIAIFGNALSMYATMRFYDHKTKHTKFMVGLPVIIILKSIFIVIITILLRKYIYI